MPSLTELGPMVEKEPEPEVDITHQRAKRCENPSCQRWFIGRSDQRVCGLPECLEWRKTQPPKQRRPRTKVTEEAEVEQTAISDEPHAITGGWHGGREDKVDAAWKPSVTVEAGNGIIKGSAIPDED